MTGSIDNTRTRSVQAEVEVPGTPGEVWRSIATGPGISSWFMPAEVEEREGGATLMRYAPGAEDTGVVTTWSPPHRFAFAEEVRLSGDGPAARLAHEFLVEARSGGTCLVRVVSSGFLDDPAWGGFADAMERGWRAMLDNLRLVRTHLAGLPSAVLLAAGSLDVGARTAWAELRAATGVGDAAPGERVELAPDGAPRLAGVVERVGDDEMAIRLDEPAPGLAELHVVGAGETAATTHLRLFLFGEEAAAIAARDEPRWRAWFAERFDARRSQAFEVEVPGTPEEVWETIATGAGISTWFVPTEVEGREGGAVVQHHDASPDGDVRATVTAWEPPRRFGFVADEPWEPSPGSRAERVAVEILVRAREGSCVVRLVNGGFGSGADWDDAIERTRRGWELCLAVLRLVRTRFPGRPSASFLLNGSAHGPMERGWAAVVEALGLPDAGEGEPAAATAPEAPPLAGTVGFRGDGQLVLVGEEGILTLTTAAMGERTLVRVQGTAFGENAQAAAAEADRAWSSWMHEHFPMAAVPA